MILAEEDMAARAQVPVRKTGVIRSQTPGDNADKVKMPGEMKTKAAKIRPIPSKNHKFPFPAVCFKMEDVIQNSINFMPVITVNHTGAMFNKFNAKRDVIT